MIFSSPRLYAISNRIASPAPPERHLEGLIRGPAEVIQWREKDLSGEAAREWIRRGCRLARQLGKWFLVNGDAETAILEECHGVHLTSLQSPARALRLRRSAKRPDFVVGKSVHSLPEALLAQSEGVDYVMLGPVFAPLSKASSLPPLGLDALREACLALRVPVAAVGGIEGERVRKVFQAGAWAAAGITWASRPDPGG